jgi:hypothetical protein
MSDAATPGEMPERYRPDPWIDSQYGCRDSQHSTVIRVPTVATRDWLTLAPGDHIGIAPCGPRSVWIGACVPRELGYARAVEQHDRDAHTVFLPAAVAKYLDIGSHDTIRYHRPEPRRSPYDRLRVERLPRDDEVTDEH